MSIDVKKRLVFSFLVLFAFWPMAHHALVRRYDMNPWKLFGWSMYCVPASFVRVLAFELRPEEESPIPYQPDTEKLVNRYIHDRWVYGTLLPPDEIARTMFAVRPALQSLKLAVDHLELDRETAYYRINRFPYVYDRARFARR